MLKQTNTQDPGHNHKQALLELKKLLNISSIKNAGHTHKLNEGTMKYGIFSDDKEERIRAGNSLIVLCKKPVTATEALEIIEHFISDDDLMGDIYKIYNINDPTSYFDKLRKDIRPVIKWHLMRMNNVSKNFISRLGG